MAGLEAQKKKRAKHNMLQHGLLIKATLTTNDGVKTLLLLPEKKFPEILKVYHDDRVAGHQWALTTHPSRLCEESSKTCHNFCTNMCGMSNVQVQYDSNGVEAESFHYAFASFGHLDYQSYQVC
ncbi:hypothetical protein HDE_07580 [Halotydeus destructor]|nr:hypothetical protein HDE_07580 [Halotydeus destructor]